MFAYNPNKRITHERQRKSWFSNQKSKLLHMSVDSTLNITDQLGLLGRIALALACKDLAAKIDAHNQLEWDGWAKYVPSTAPLDGPERTVQFFVLRLGKGWVDRSLKLRYCRSCAKFLPLAPTTYWFKKLQDEYEGKPGMLSRHVEEKYLKMDSSDYYGGLLLKNMWHWYNMSQHSCPPCRLV